MAAPPVKTVVMILYIKSGTPNDPTTPAQMLLIEFTTKVIPAHGAEHLA